MEKAHTVKINKNKKLVITGDSLLNGISEKMLSRNHQVTVKNFPGRTSRTFPGELRVADKPERIIIHALTLQKVINSLSSVEKIVKNVKKNSPNTKLAFSTILLRKYKKDISKKVTDINSCSKNYCQEKHLEETLGQQETSSKQTRKFSFS